MKYREFKHLVEVILTGDIAISDDDAYLLAAMRYAFETVAMSTDVAVLTVTEEEYQQVKDTREVVRVDLQNKRRTLRPRIPINDDDDIDLDEGVCFTAARLVASLFSIEKMQYHRDIAMNELKDYNELLQAMREMELNNEAYSY